MNESEINYYTDLEIESLIDNLSDIAKESIEQAGADAAKAAALAALERQAELLREKAEAEQEAKQWKIETETAKKAGAKNAVITGLICFLGGLALGIGGTIALSN